MNQLSYLTDELADMTGLPAQKEPPVMVPGCRAQMLYFRERRDVNVRGGCILLDVGSNGASVALWLRGRQAPVLQMALPLGVDLMLETMADESQISALLHLHGAFLMLLSGVMAQSVYMTSSVSHLLPETMPVCMAGRGGSLLQRIDEMDRIRLLDFMRPAMEETHPTVSAGYVFSEYPKMETAAGLVLYAPEQEEDTASAGIAMRTPWPPEQLLIGFMRLFGVRFPWEAAAMFPQMFARDGYLSVDGENLLMALAEECMTGQPLTDGLLRVIAQLRTMAFPMGGSMDEM
ncbi:MAG: hypothetical protein Q4C54_00650 [Clostridia bacterium]|nr:hypothetical protein [Clostridia bacterium]